MPTGVHLPRVEKNCLGCRKLISVVGSRAHKQKFCSRECAGLTKIEILRHCQKCQGLFRQTSHKRQQNFCSKRCWAEEMANRKVQEHLEKGEFPNRKSAKEYLMAISPGCHQCGWSVRLEVLELHHIDRNIANNCIENLELLCPNCHSVEHFIAQDGQFKNNFGKKNDTSTQI